ncbi:hypothetical protein HDU96_009543 [Phlyctochytrium bullatum]|nr:hypothetical protein HDU96_009543 [Phlyctochytrium bullatum]
MSTHSRLSRAITHLKPVFAQPLSLALRPTRHHLSTSSALGTRFSRFPIARSLAVASTFGLVAALAGHPLQSESSKPMSTTTAASSSSRLVEGEVEVPLGTFTYRVRLPAGSSGLDPSKPVLVFIHGLFVNSLIWDDAMDHVASRGFQCVALDLPLGCHLHPVKDRSQLNFANVAKSVEAAVEKIGVKKYVIVGNDTGGVVVQKVIQLDLERPEKERRITGMVMTPCDCFENFLPAPVQPLIVAARNIPGLLHISALGRMYYYPFLANSPVLAGWVIKKGIPPRLANHFGDRITASYAIQADIKQILQDVRPEVTMEVAKDLHRFKKPTFVITAPEDTGLFSEKFMLQFAEALRKPFDATYARNEFNGVEYGEVKIRPVKDSYAFVMVDQPKETAEIVVEYMKTYAV